jgi:hypothetical protein
LTDCRPQVRRLAADVLASAKEVESISDRLRSKSRTGGAVSQLVCDGKVLAVHGRGRGLQRPGRPLPAIPPPSLRRAAHDSSSDDEQ